MGIDHKNKSWNVRQLEFTASVCAAILVIIPVVASAFEVSGDWLPGALLQGKATPHAKVEVLGRVVEADSDGNFVFGLGRDTQGEVIIRLEAAGQSKRFAYAVKPREYKLQRVNGVDKKYVSPPQEVKARISREAAQIWAARQIVSTEPNYRQGFIWPAEGPITGVYGSQRVFNGEPKRPHYGLDIAGPVGTEIIAPVSGVVTLAESDLYYSGGTLIIDHGYGISSTFIHLSKLLVSKGQKVKQGSLIALMGATGRVTGPHLDWRVNWFNQRLDPELLLPVKPSAPHSQ